MTQTPDQTLNPHESSSSRRKLSYDFVSLASDLLPVWDVLIMLLVPFLTEYLYATFFGTRVAYDPMTWADNQKQALAAAVLAPFVLYDRAFGTDPERRRDLALLRNFTTQWTKFVGVLLAVGFASRILDDVPRAWALIWLGLSFVFTLAARALLARHLRHLETRGVLTQAIAVVGAGPLADRLIKHLLQSQPGKIELLGVFDDRGSRNDGRMFLPKGTIADLLELGKTRPSTGFSWPCRQRPMIACCRSCIP